MHLTSVTAPPNPLQHAQDNSVCGLSSAGCRWHFRKQRHSGRIGRRMHDRLCRKQREVVGCRVHGRLVKIDEMSSPDVDHDGANGAEPQSVWGSQPSPVSVRPQGTHSRIQIRIWLRQEIWRTVYASNLSLWRTVYSSNLSLWLTWHTTSPAAS